MLRNTDATEHETALQSITMVSRRRRRIQCLSIFPCTFYTMYTMSVIQSSLKTLPDVAKDFHLLQITFSFSFSPKADCIFSIGS